MSSFPVLKKKELPEPPPLSQAIGVGVVVMGLAIGTGELIIWPHLFVKYGLGLLWLAFAGILCQFFINHEVARHALATGEGFFTSSARVIKWSPVVWFFSAILLYIWPGWASAIGTILKELFGFGSYQVWAWCALGLILVLTYGGKVAYNMLEKSLKVTVPTFFVLLVVVSFLNLNMGVLKEAFWGLLNIGWIPDGIDLNLLLGAVVFAGAGGMLNLCISLWYRDKQMGMARSIGRITNPITGKQETISPTGYKFALNAKNLKRWKGWMRVVRVDQGIIFTGLGFLTLALLGINAYAVLRPLGLVPEGTQVAIVQAHIFGQQLGTGGYTLFLVMAFFMLFSVMWTVLDALTRITSDILYTNARVGSFQRILKPLQHVSLGHLYYAIMTLAVLMSALLIPLKQPLGLLITSAVLGGMSMAVYTPLLIYLNNVHLPKPLRPHWSITAVMICISIFFLYFAIRIIQSYL